MSFREKLRRAWETGTISPDGWGWEGGQVEPEVPPGFIGEGSQTPPAHDRNGNPVEVPDVTSPDVKDVERVASKWLQRQLHTKTAARTKTAGEVRFIKDRGGDKNEWGWGTPGPSEREIGANFEFKATKLKPLATSLRASLIALGHTMSAYETFAKVKSATVSPDGALGGKGYIQKISEMRRQYMNVIEALSALTDTLYDEINAPHWNPAIDEQSPREREEVQDIMQDVEDIRKDPEEFAEKEEAELDAQNAKKASRAKHASMGRRADGYDRASRWFDAEMQKLLKKELGVVERSVKAKIEQLFVKAVHMGGGKVIDANRAAEDIWDRLFEYGLEASWSGWASDNFWLNSFYYADFEGARTAALQKEQEPTWVNDLHQVRIRRVAEAFLAKKRGAE